MFHVETGFDVNVHCPKTLIEIASENNHWNVVVYLYQKGATTDPSIVFSKFKFPLHFCCDIGSIEAVQLLLDKRVLSTVSPDHGCFAPLIFALSCLKPTAP